MQLSVIILCQFNSILAKQGKLWILIFHFQKGKDIISWGMICRKKWFLGIILGVERKKISFCKGLNKVKWIFLEHDFSKFLIC